MWTFQAGDVREVICGMFSSDPLKPTEHHLNHSDEHKGSLPSRIVYFLHDDVTKNHLKQSSWYSPVSRSESYRAPQGSGRTGEKCAEQKYAAVSWCNHVNMYHRNTRRTSWNAWKEDLRRKVCGESEVVWVCAGDVVVERFVILSISMVSFNKVHLSVNNCWCEWFVCTGVNNLSSMKISLANVSALVS